ncbi:Sec-independent protein translocase TatC [Hoeflea halophila]|uniref:Sec-independent protein translocase protein TatC n=1 Tax=Hoeflea halophila TaxID=714899 RepID=A0A286HKQ6_9HYPH|nr:twin-arginine translocase subunit TatC [Hoeflea halophila]SOE08390.1 Sec-independent protein translocase TatC [Hoeflea halophila]
MTDDIDDKPQPLMMHLMELRNRLMWAVGAFFIAFVLCFAFAKPLFNMLVLPFTWAVDWAGMSDREIELIYTAPQEFFFTQIKIGMFGGLVLAFPMIASQVYKFVAPGLYKNERGAFLPFLVASPLLFLLGGALVYFFFTPMVMWFFLSMEQVGGTGEASIMLLPKVSEYLGLIMTLIFAFGLVFQLPVVTTLLARVGLVTSQGLADKRKYAIVAAFVAAAILTPPDPVSQIGLALPTIILYEIAIYCARLVERQRAARAAVGEAEDASAAASDPEGDA